MDWQEAKKIINSEDPDYPTEPMEPIDDLAPARGFINGVLFSIPIWIAVGFVAWCVGKVMRWW